MARKVEQGTSSVEGAAPEENAELRTWLEAQAPRLQRSAGDPLWLLAHAEDGVIWGVLEAGQLALSCDAGAFQQSGLSLRREALQQLRLFGAAAELLLWNGPTGLDGCLRRDGAGTPVEYLDEEYMLWGDRAGATRGAFREAFEGSQGIYHTPPTRGSLSTFSRSQLHVRHYLGIDPGSGAARIVGSRLIAVK